MQRNRVWVRRKESGYKTSHGKCGNFGEGLSLGREGLSLHEEGA